jgi:hypothetical protein
MLLCTPLGFSPDEALREPHLGLSSRRFHMMVRAGVAGMHVQPRPRKNFKGRFEFQVSSFMVFGICSKPETGNLKLGMGL